MDMMKVNDHPALAPGGSGEGWDQWLPHVLDSNGEDLIKLGGGHQGVNWGIYNDVVIIPNKSKGYKNIAYVGPHHTQFIIHSNYKGAFFFFHQRNKLEF